MCLGNAVNALIGRRQIQPFRNSWRNLMAKPNCFEFSHIAGISTQEGGTESLKRITLCLGGREGGD
jgi:hypothetical protein